MKICPNELKKLLQRQNWMQELRQPSRCINEAIDRSRAHWESYEKINRDFCPEDPVYCISRSGVALSTTADHLTCQAASAGQGRILEVITGGEATSSAVNRIAVQRSGTSITSNSAQTPEKYNTRSPAAAGTYGSGGTQSLSGNPLQVFAVNAFGGFIRWVAAPGEEMYYVNSEVISMRSLSGTSTFSSTIIFEEL